LDTISPPNHDLLTISLNVPGFIQFKEVQQALHIKVGFNRHTSKVVICGTGMYGGFQ
jgi:hypothetical protein